MSEDKEAGEHKRADPRWDVINELYDKIDDSLVEMAEKKEMNFMEISMALHLVNKKIEYEQLKAMFQFSVECTEKESKEVDKKRPEGMYG